MKVKRLIMVRHADGRNEYVCRACGQKMRHCDNGHMSFGRGEVEESGEEYLFCDICGIRSGYPQIPDHHFPGFTIDA